LSSAPRSWQSCLKREYKAALRGFAGDLSKRHGLKKVPKSLRQSLQKNAKDHAKFKCTLRFAYRR